MKVSFEIINDGFARHVLGNKLSGDPVKDAITALHMNHDSRDKEKKPSRLHKWAIFRASGSTLASDLAAYPSGDERRANEAFGAELRNLAEPVVLVTFTNALINADTLRATYDPRIVSICRPSGIETIDVTVPRSKHPLAREYRKEVQPNAL